MAFRVGSNVFVHADAVCKLTPLEGDSRGQPFTIKAASKFEAKLNAKVLAVKGNAIVPVALAMGEAEPSFSIGLDTAMVSVDYAEHCGSGWMRMAHNIVVTMTRPGLAPVTFKLKTCFFENGFGLMSDAGSQVKDDLSGKFRELLLDYKGKELDPFKLPGGVNIV